MILAHITEGLCPARMSVCTSSVPSRHGAAPRRKSKLSAGYYSITRINVQTVKIPIAMGTRIHRQAYLWRCLHFQLVLTQTRRNRTGGNSKAL